MENAVTNARGNTWVWMGVAFAASLGLGLASLSVVRHRNISIALAMSARVAFLFFLPAYVGGALTSLFGSIFLPLKVRARDFGLAFVAAISVHLSFVVYLCLFGDTPSAKTFVIFGIAAFFTYLLAALSISRVRQALPPSFWPPLRFVAINYIALAFLFDFWKFPISDLRESLIYLPFVPLAIMGPALQFAVWLRDHCRGNWAESP